MCAGQREAPFTTRHTLSMRLLLQLTVAASSSTFVSPVGAFVPQAPHAAAAGWKTKPVRLETRVSVASDASGSGGGRVLPPRDETFNPLAILRELEASPDVVDGAERYDRMGGADGGIWRSVVIGFLPCTVCFLRRE